MTDSSDNDELERLIPREMLVKLSSPIAGQAMAGKRRTVMMLSADLAGSISSAGRFDSDEWADLMNATSVHLIEPTTI